MIIHNLTNFHQNRMLSSPLIVFTDKVTHRQTDRQTDTHTDKSDHNTPSQNLWRGKNNIYIPNLYKSVYLFTYLHLLFPFILRKTECKETIQTNKLTDFVFFTTTKENICDKQIQTTLSSIYLSCIVFLFKFGIHCAIIHI